MCFKRTKIERFHFGIENGWIWNRSIKLILYYCNIVLFHNIQTLRVPKRKRFHFGTENGWIWNISIKLILYYCNIVLFHNTQIPKRKCFHGTENGWI